MVPTIEPPELTLQEEISGGERVYMASRLLWEHRGLIARWVLRGCLGVLILALLLPNFYESETQLMPPDSQSAASMLSAMVGATGSGSGSGTGGGGALSLAADLLGVRTSGALFISILTSETLENRIINRFDLRRVYWIGTYRAARKKLEARTDIREQKKSGVISITVTDHNPGRAADIARAYVEELNRMLADLNTSTAHRERLFLEERLRVVKQELDQSAKEFSEFSSRNTAIDIKEQGRAMVEAAAILQGQEIAAESELRGLEQIYTPGNVRVRSLRARMAELQNQLQKLGGADSSVPSDPENVPALYPSIRQLPKLGLTYSDLFRQVKINEAVFEFLTKEYEYARVQEAKEIPTVKVIDQAQIPERKSWPPRALIVLGGCFISFCATCVWLFGREAWNGADPQNPKKMFLEEIATEVRNKLRWQHARKVSLDAVPGTLRRRLWKNNNHSH